MLPKGEHIVMEQDKMHWENIYRTKNSDEVSWTRGGTSNIPEFHP